MSRSKMDREVKGRGLYGVCSGGLAGDGDVFMVATETSAREKLVGFFREQLNPDAPVGVMVRGGYVHADLARAMLGDVSEQLSGWAGTVHGEVLDVSVRTPVATLRAGIFKCWHGPDPANPGGPNSFWIPPQVRLHAGAQRRIEVAEPKSKGRRR